jgi:phage terminase small subunit
MGKRRTPRAPGHLRTETRKWFGSILDSYELESHHIKLLTLAAECWDRIVQAREQIKLDGLFLRDRYGSMKAHPGVKVEIDNKITFARLIRELGFDIERGTESNRPPRLY